MSATKRITRRAAHPTKILRLQVQPIVDEFLEEIEQTLAPATERAYRIPLSLFMRHLRTTLDREPTLDDLTIERVRGWITILREQPKHLRGGQAMGASPIALTSLRNYLRHLRAFANWLPKPPQRYVDESPLRYLKAPRGEETPKIPVEAGALQRLLRRAGTTATSRAGSRARLQPKSLPTRASRASSGSTKTKKPIGAWNQAQPPKPPLAMPCATQRSRATGFVRSQ